MRMRDGRVGLDGRWGCGMQFGGGRGAWVRGVGGFGMGVLDMVKKEAGELGRKGKDFLGVDARITHAWPWSSSYIAIQSISHPGLNSKRKEGFSGWAS